MLGNNMLGELSTADLLLSVRATHVVEKLGVKTVAELAALSDQVILAIKGCGAKTLAEIRYCLQPDQIESVKRFWAEAATYREAWRKEPHFSGLGYGAECDKEMLALKAEGTSLAELGRKYGMSAATAKNRIAYEALRQYLENYSRE